MQRCGVDEKKKTRQKGDIKEEQGYENLIQNFHILFQAVSLSQLLSSKLVTPQILGNL